MARKIAEIQQGIIDGLNPAGRGLSTSKYAEWRLVSYVMAAAIHAFEVILDLFRTEVESKAYANTSGTIAWYREMSLRFQYGHELVYVPDTAFYKYASADPDARIVKVVAIVEQPLHLYIKVAKQDGEGKIIPLTDTERMAFADYWRTMRISGTDITIISTTADMIRYNVEVLYDPSVQRDTVAASVLAALEAFKTSLSFDAIFYTQRLIDAMMHATGVVSVNPVSVEHKSTEEGQYQPAGVFTELASGYFDYDQDSTITLTSIRS